MLILKEMVKIKIKGKDFVYGNANDEVELISTHGEVYIVMNKKTKELFSCRKEKIIEITLNKELEAKIIDFDIKTDFEEKPKFIKFDEPIKKKEPTKQKPKNNQLSLL